MTQLILFNFLPYFKSSAVLTAQCPWDALSCGDLPISPETRLPASCRVCITVARQSAQKSCNRGGCSLGSDVGEPAVHMPDPVLASDLVEWNPACTLEQLTISVVLITVAVKMKNYPYTYRVNSRSWMFGGSRRVGECGHGWLWGPREASGMDLELKALL